MLDSVIETDYPQTFLEECKYIQGKIKFENYINEELDSDSNDEKESNIDSDESLIIYVIHALLGFYFRHFV